MGPWAPRGLREDVDSAFPSLSPEAHSRARFTFPCFPSHTQATLPRDLPFRWATAPWRQELQPRVSALHTPTVGHLMHVVFASALLGGPHPARVKLGSDRREQGPNRCSQLLHLLHAIILFSVELFVLLHLKIMLAVTHIVNLLGCNLELNKKKH